MKRKIYGLEGKILEVKGREEEKEEMEKKSMKIRDDEREIMEKREKEREKERKEAKEILERKEKEIETLRND